MAIAIAIAVGLAGAAQAAGAPEIGQVKNVSGQVTVTRAAEVIPVAVGTALYQNDVITTGDDASVGMTFIDNSRFSAGANTELALERFRFNVLTNKGSSLTRMKRGTLNAVSGKIALNQPGAMKVATPTSILGVRGTNFLVQVEE